jgi:hypothetical protein
LHGHQAKSLALMALSMSQAGRCQSTWMALHAPVNVKLASTRRRFERFLANSRVDHVLAAMGLATAFCRRWTDRTILLLLDETAVGNRLRSMKVSVGCRGRAMPLAWICYDPDDLPATQPEIVELLLQQVRLCMPASAKIVLMADRGLSWPLLIDLCEQFGWDYLLRVQGQTVVKRSDGAQHPVRHLVTRRGERWRGSVHVFKRAGWRRCHVVAEWPAREHEPWLLITSLPPRQKWCRRYRKRMWQEESFRDEKSHGFHWHQSRVWHPEHADRLLLAMQLATWMTMILGQEIERRGYRQQVEATSRPTLSLFQLGYRAWQIQPLLTLLRAPTRMHLDPDDDP